MTQITDKDIMKMTEDEKIIATVKALGANSFETAVTMEQIIGAAIEMGFTADHLVENWEGYKEGDHPWWSRVAPMMGIGTQVMVEEHEDKHLHRQKVKMSKETGRKTSVMVYWYDPFTEHEVVEKKTKAVRKKKSTDVEVPLMTTKTINLTSEQKQVKAESSDGRYVVINGKLVSKAWIEKNPEKAQAMYGVSSL